MTYNIIKFKYEKDFLKLFQTLPDLVYANDPKRVKSFKDDEIKYLDENNPLWKKMPHQKFLALKHGSIVARCVATINSEMTLDGKQIGQIGFFDALNDHEAVHKILDEATQWLKEQNIKEIVAPMNFTTWHSYRFKIDSFDQDTYLFEPYNPPYYPQFFEREGFSILRNYFTREIPDISRVVHENEEKFKKLIDSGVVVRPFKIKEFDEEMKKLYQLCIETFNGNFLYTPISFEDFKKMYSDGKNLIIPDYFSIAEDKGKIVGFLFCLPDYGKALRMMKGKKNIFAKLQFLYHKKQADTLLAKSMAVLPEYRRQGVGAAVIYHAHKNALKNGIKKGKHCLVISDNFSGKYSKENDVQRNYALFHKMV